MESKSGHAAGAATAGEMRGRSEGAAWAGNRVWGCEEGIEKGRRFEHGAVRATTAKSVWLRGDLGYGANWGAGAEFEIGARRSGAGGKGGRGREGWAGEGGERTRLLGGFGRAGV